MPLPEVLSHESSMSILRHLFHVHVQKQVAKVSRTMVWDAECHAHTLHLAEIEADVWP